MSTAALGSAGAGEPPHLPDRTTNTPTTWRLYSPLCCSRAAAAAARPPPAPAGGQGWPDGCPGNPRPSCWPRLCPARPRARKGRPCCRKWPWTLKLCWGQNCRFLDPHHNTRFHFVCVFLSLQILWIFFPQLKFCREWLKISKVTLVHKS